MKKKADTMSEDKETIINFSEYHLGEWAEVYTTDKQVMLRYEKFCNAHPDMAKLIKEDKYSMTFSVHPKCAGIYPKAIVKMSLTEEQRETRRQAFLKAVKKEM